MIDLKKKWAYARDPFTEVKVTRNNARAGGQFVFRSEWDDNFVETHIASGHALAKGNGESPFDLVPLETLKPTIKELETTLAAALDKHDPVNHPKHYTSHPSGVECIDIVRHMTFNCGNVVKYIWRAGLKDQTAEIEDLEKGMWYLADEIAKRKRESGKS